MASIEETRTRLGAIKEVWMRSTVDDTSLDDEVRKLNAEGVLSWRRIFGRLLENAATQYPLKVDKDIDELADMLTSVIEGGIIMSKLLDDKDILPKQILQYREYIRLAFGDI